MKREVFAWLAAIIVLVALWLAPALALQIFDPRQSDIEPGEFLGLGPMWFYLELILNVAATVFFAIAIIIRIGWLAIRLWQNRKAKFSN